MKKRRITLISVTAAVVLFFTAYMVFYVVPSEYGKRPFYNLTMQKVESVKIHKGIGRIDKWQGDMSEAETQKLIGLIQNIRIDGKTDMSEYEMPDGLGSGDESFCLKLASGRNLRIGTYSANGNNYLIIDFVKYDVSDESIDTYNELQTFYNALLSSKGATYSYSTTS